MVDFSESSEAPALTDLEQSPFTNKSGNQSLDTSVEDGCSDRDVTIPLVDNVCTNDMNSYYDENVSNNCEDTTNSTEHVEVIRASFKPAIHNHREYMKKAHSVRVGKIKLKGMKYRCHRCTMSIEVAKNVDLISCLLYTSPSPRDLSTSRMPSSA